MRHFCCIVLIFLSMSIKSSVSHASKKDGLDIKYQAYSPNLMWVESYFSSFYQLVLFQTRLPEDFGSLKLRCFSIHVLQNFFITEADWSFGGGIKLFFVGNELNIYFLLKDKYRFLNTPGSFFFRVMQSERFLEESFDHLKANYMASWKAHPSEKLNFQRSIYDHQNFSNILDQDWTNLNCGDITEITYDEMHMFIRHVLLMSKFSIGFSAASMAPAAHDYFTNMLQRLRFFQLRQDLILTQDQLLPDSLRGIRRRDIPKKMLVCSVLEEELDSEAYIFYRFSTLSYGSLSEIWYVMTQLYARIYKGLENIQYSNKRHVNIFFNIYPVQDEIVFIIRLEPLIVSGEWYKQIVQMNFNQELWTVPVPEGKDIFALLKFHWFQQNIYQILYQALWLNNNDLVVRGMQFQMRDFMEDVSFDENLPLKDLISVALYIQGTKNEDLETLCQRYDATFWKK